MASPDGFDSAAGARVQPVARGHVVEEVLVAVGRGDPNAAAEVEPRRVGDVEALAAVADHAAGCGAQRRHAALRCGIVEILHPHLVGVGIERKVDQRIAVRPVGVVERVGVPIDILEIGIGEEVVVVELRAELQHLLGRQRQVHLEQAGEQILMREGNGDAIAVPVVVGLAMADGAGNADAAVGYAGREHFLPAHAVGAVGHAWSARRPSVRA